MKGFARSAWRSLERAGSRLGLGRLRRIPGFERLYYGRLQGAAHALSREDVAMVQGHLMRLDAGDHLRLSLNGVYEPFVTSILTRLVKKGSVVLDVGANIGYHTLLMARAAGPEGRVHAFEPHPSNFAILSENVRRNGYANVSLHQAALSDAPGIVTLHVHETAGGHSLRAMPDARTIEVPALRLDDALADVPRVDVMKMDVEGAEGIVLAGMERLLAASDGLVLVMELNAEYLDQTPRGARETLATLAKHGFRGHLIDENRRRIVPATEEDLLACRGENVLFSRGPDVLAFASG